MQKKSEININSNKKESPLQKKNTKLSIVSQIKDNQPVISYTSPAVSPKNPISICVQTTARLIMDDTSSKQPEVNQSNKQKLELQLASNSKSKYLCDVYPYTSVRKILPMREKTFLPIIQSASQKQLISQQTQCLNPYNQQTSCRNKSKEYFDHKEIYINKQQVDYSTQNAISPTNNHDIKYYANIPKLQQYPKQQISYNSQSKQQKNIINQHYIANNNIKLHKKQQQSMKNQIIMNQDNSIMQHTFSTNIKNYNYNKKRNQFDNKKSSLNHIIIHDDDNSQCIGDEQIKILTKEQQKQLEQLKQFKQYQDKKEIIIKCPLISKQPSLIQEQIRKQSKQKKQNLSLNENFMNNTKQYLSQQLYKNTIKQNKKINSSNKLKQFRLVSQEKTNINDTIEINKKDRFIQNKNNYLNYLQSRQQNSKYLHKNQHHNFTNTLSKNKNKRYSLPQKKPLSLKCQKLVDRLYTDRVKYMGTLCVRYEKQMRMDNMDTLNRIINNYPLLKNNLLQRQKLDLLKYLVHLKIPISQWAEKLIDYIQNKIHQLKIKS